MPGSRRLGLRRQTGEHRAAAFPGAHVAAPLSKTEVATQDRSGKVNILLVDDQAARLMSYESILAPLGQNLICARSGSEALERLMGNEFALILLDVSMPGMDGFETAAMIHD